MEQNFSKIHKKRTLSIPDLSPMRIVLLGKTGCGKSSAGNTIFGGGKEEFKIKSSANSETHKCEAKTKIINGRKITVVDTPGLFDTDIPEEKLKAELVKCIVECAPGPHAFLIVLRVDRYTVHEEQVIAEIEKCFTPEALKYATVLFTHGYQLKGEIIEDFVKTNDKLSELVEKCGGRCHVIDNEHWNNQYQVTELLNTIEKMVRKDGGGCYTNELLQEAERLIQVEIMSLSESKGQMSEEEMRKQAKERVRRKLLIKLSGVATGVMVGALLGIAGSLAIVLLLLAQPLVILGKAIGAAAVGAAVAGAGGSAVVGSAAVAGVAGVVGSGAGVAGAVGSAAVGAAAVAGAGGSAAAGAAAVAAAVEMGGLVAVETGATIGVSAGLGIAAGVVAGTAALAGGIRGGIIGAAAAEDSETPGEAAKKAANAVYEDAGAIWKKGEGIVDRVRGMLKGYSTLSSCDEN